MTTQIDSNWKRIAGMHITEAGDIAVVWMAYDKLTDTIHIYNSELFRHQPWPVVGDGITCVGRWIPIAWCEKQKLTAEQLRLRGCNLIDPLKEDETLAEVNQREVHTRYLTGRLKVGRNLANWHDEFKTYYRDKTKVPIDSHPLMAATRYAVAQLSWAKAQKLSTRQQRNYPQAAII